MQTNKNLSRNKTGSALLISLVVLVILTVMSTVFIEKLLSFSKSSEGIENSNVAYYNALGAIEEQLFTGGVNKKAPWNIQNKSSGSFTQTGKALTALTGGTTIPIAGNGNSPYDSNWNLISMGDPVQLVIPNGINWSNVNFFFRIPKVETYQTTGTGINSSLNNSGIILWTLTSTGKTLFASGESNIFRGVDIDGIAKKINTMSGITNTGALKTFDTFYTNDLGASGADCTNYRCTLKLSMIKSVNTNDVPTQDIPFLEYKINLGSNPPIPQEFMTIESQGYAYGFMRSRTLRLPQITTNNTLDFAVVQ